jgi:hypothetical protein
MSSTVWFIILILVIVFILIGLVYWNKSPAPVAATDIPLPKESSVPKPIEKETADTSPVAPAPTSGSIPGFGRAPAPMDDTLRADAYTDSKEAWDRTDVGMISSAGESARGVQQHGIGGLKYESDTGNFLSIGSDAKPSAAYDYPTVDGIPVDQYGHQQMNPIQGMFPNTEQEEQPGQGLLPSKEVAVDSAKGSKSLTTAIASGTWAVEGDLPPFWRPADSQISCRAASGFISSDSRPPPDCGFPELPNTPFGRPTVSPGQTVGLAQYPNLGFISQPIDPTKDYA